MLLTLPNLVVLQQKNVGDISWEKFWFLEKFTKFGEHMSIGQALHAKFHRARSNDVREKRYKLLHPSVF